MLSYEGNNVWSQLQVTQGVRAIVKLDLPETSFMATLMADIENQKGSLSVKRSITMPSDIYIP